VAGEITPLELRPLASRPLIHLDDKVQATIEFAGAAPGLVAGVNQVNIRLPNPLPQFANTAAVVLVTGSAPSAATIAVE